MSNPLIEIIDGKRYHDTLYDAQEIFEILSDIQGIRDLRRDASGGSVNAEYHCELGWTYVELSDDNHRIQMRHSDDVGLQLAVEISKRYQVRHGASLEISDSEYNFHQKLDGIETLQDLQKSIEESPFLE